MRRLSIHDHVGVFMRTFPRPNSSFRAQVCQASIKVLFYVLSRGNDESRFFVVFLLADKLMVEASTDFHNFEEDESLSARRRFGISLFFLFGAFQEVWLLQRMYRDVSGRCQRSACMRETNDFGWWMIHSYKKRYVMWAAALLLARKRICTWDSGQLTSLCKFI